MTIAEMRAARKPYVRPDADDNAYVWRRYDGFTTEWVSQQRFATWQEAVAAAGAIGECYGYEVIIPDGDPALKQWAQDGRPTVGYRAFQNVEPWMAGGRVQYEPGYAEACQH